MCGGERKIESMYNSAGAATEMCSGGQKNGEAGNSEAPCHDEETG